MISGFFKCILIFCSVCPLFHKGVKKAEILKGKRNCVCSSTTATKSATSFLVPRDTSERVALVPIFHSAFSVAALNPISVLAVSYPHIIGSRDQTLYAKSLDALSHPCYIIINQYYPAGTGGDTDEETLYIVTCMSTSVHRLHARELSSCIQHVNQPLIPRLGPP